MAGGDGGGLIVAEGTPEDVRQHATSHTGLALREYAESMGEVLGVAERLGSYGGGGGGVGGGAKNRGWAKKKTQKTPPTP